MSPGVAASTTTPATSSRASAGTQEAAATATRAPGDLDTGSITHSVAAGDSTVVLDYWTTDDATAWTAADVKAIQLSAHIEGGTGAATKVTRFVATVDDGTSRTQISEDRGEFVITPPFSYATALSLAPSAKSATSLTVYVQFDLLVETAHGAGTWFRQTVLDTLHLPLEENPS
jgi:hypothetical protein